MRLCVSLVRGIALISAVNLHESLKQYATCTDLMFPRPDCPLCVFFAGGFDLGFDSLVVLFRLVFL